MAASCVLALPVWNGKGGLISKEIFTSSKNVSNLTLKFPTLIEKVEESVWNKSEIDCIKNWLNSTVKDELSELLNFIIYILDLS